MTDEEKEYIKENVGIRPSLDMIHLDHQDMMFHEHGMLNNRLCKIGIIGVGTDTGLAMALAERNANKQSLVINQEQNKEDLIKRLEELLNKRFRTYMYGEQFDNFSDIQKHLRIFDYFEKKDRSNQDQLFAIGLDTFDKFEAEYLLIKSKSSKLPSAIRKVVENVWNDVTKSE